METFHLNPEFFPTNTRELLPRDLILQLGVLPLGFKHAMHFFRPCKRLNVGLLDPRRDTIKRVKKMLREKLGKEEFGSFQLYRLHADEFLQILETIYHIPKDSLLRLDSAALTPVLRHFLNAGPKG